MSSIPYRDPTDQHLQDPTNSSIPGSLFEHPALQEVLNRTFYNDEGSSEAILLPKYFENGLPEKALAFFATAVSLSLNFKPIY
jgi:hypothetical protein